MVKITAAFVGASSWPTALLLKTKDFCLAAIGQRRNLLHSFGMHSPLVSAVVA
jgi:hypothetical protein